MTTEKTASGPGGLRLDSAPLGALMDGVRISLSGKSDSASFRILQETFDGHLDSGKGKILVDCDRLEFLNSTALGYLINLSDRIEKARGGMAFVRVPRKVRTVFELLGLVDFFPIFETEKEGYVYLIKDSGEPSRVPAPAPRAPVLASPPPRAPVPASPPPRAPVPASPPPRAPVPASPPPRAPVPVSPPARAPSPAPVRSAPVAPERPSPAPPVPTAVPSVDHPRWSVLLETVGERVGFGALEEVCRMKGLSPDGEIPTVIRRIARSFGSPGELLSAFDEATLEGLCRLYRLPSEGDQAARSTRIMEFVGRSTTDSLLEVLKAARSLPRIEPSMLPVELTRDNLLRTLERTIVPRRIRSDAAARKIVVGRLWRVFGKDRVAGGKRGEPSRVHAVELSLGGEFAVEIRTARALFREAGWSAKELQRLLGQLVVLCKHYEPANVFAVVVGAVDEDQGGLLEEARGLFGMLGISFVHLR